MRLGGPADKRRLTVSDKSRCSLYHRCIRIPAEAKLWIVSPIILCDQDYSHLVAEHMTSMSEGAATSLAYHQLCAADAENSDVMHSSKLVHIRALCQQWQVQQHNNYCWKHGLIC